MSDHGFKKACPTGNHMLDCRYPEPKGNGVDMRLTCDGCGVPIEDGEEHEDNGAYLCDVCWKHILEEEHDGQAEVFGG